MSFFDLELLSDYRYIECSKLSKL